jgi:hypothetical protein
MDFQILVEQLQTAAGFEAQDVFDRRVHDETDFEHFYRYWAGMGPCPYQGPRRVR